MSVVIDASAALAWCYEDEQTPALLQLMQQVVLHGAVVPALWRLEVANGLRSGIRRGRMSIAKRDEIFQDLLDFPITIDEETNRHAWNTTTALADKHMLTPYDACYLELAQRLGLPLATQDVALINAANSAKVKLVKL
jgi:predicted nucleic acid-binding protein